MIDRKSNDTAADITNSDTSLPRIHFLKVPNRALQKPFWIAFMVFLVCLPILDIPMSDKSFPPQITEIATNLLKASLILMLTLVVIFTFHRKKITVELHETGIQISGEDFLPWQMIQWYRIDIFSANGIRKVVLKVKGRKITIVADDGIAFSELEKEIRELIGSYNPLAKDYNTLNVSRNWGYGYIALFTIIHVVISYLTDFEVKYMVIFTPTLLFIVMIIYVEKIRKTVKN